MPSIHTIKNTVQKQRCERFLLYDGRLGDIRSLVFSAYNDMIYLFQQENWYSDDIFYICPSIFYQTYSIHVYYDGISTPCIFALLSSKSEQTYTDIFALIFKKMFEFDLLVRLRTITIDFEQAVKNVFTKHYPTITVRGYLFHYGQSLHRKFVALGLKAAYKNDENLRDWFRSLAVLSLLSLNHMLWGLQYLIHTQPVYIH
ncbi:unnamed protein product, partial [Rotaria sordida]